LIIQRRYAEAGAALGAGTAYLTASTNTARAINRLKEEAALGRALEPLPYRKGYGARDYARAFAPLDPDDVSSNRHLDPERVRTATRLPFRLDTL
jgi:hypothetical protein